MSQPDHDDFGNPLASKGNGWMTLAELAEQRRSSAGVEDEEAQRKIEDEQKRNSLRKQMGSGGMYGLEQKLAAVADDRRTTLASMMQAARRKPNQTQEILAQHQQQQADAATAKLAPATEEKRRLSSKPPPSPVSVGIPSDSSPVANKTLEEKQDSNERRGSVTKTMEEKQNSMESQTIATQREEIPAEAPSSTPERRQSASFTAGALPFRRRQSGTPLPNEKKEETGTEARTTSAVSVAQPEEVRRSSIAATMGGESRRTSFALTEVESNEEVDQPLVATPINAEKRRTSVTETITQTQERRESVVKTATETPARRPSIVKPIPETKPTEEKKRVTFSAAPVIEERTLIERESSDMTEEVDNDLRRSSMAATMGGESRSSFAFTEETISRTTSIAQPEDVRRSSAAATIGAESRSSFAFTEEDVRTTSAVSVAQPDDVRRSSAAATMGAESRTSSAFTEETVSRATSAVSLAQPDDVRRSSMAATVGGESRGSFAFTEVEETTEDRRSSVVMVDVGDEEDTSAKVAALVLATRRTTRTPQKEKRSSAVKASSEVPSASEPMTTDQATSEQESTRRASVVLVPSETETTRRSSVVQVPVEAETRRASVVMSEQPSTSTLPSIARRTSLSSPSLTTEVKPSSPVEVVRRSSTIVLATPATGSGLFMVEAPITRDDEELSFVPRDEDLAMVGDEELTIAREASSSMVVDEDNVATAEVVLSPTEAIDRATRRASLSIQQDMTRRTSFIQQEEATTRRASIIQEEIAGGIPPLSPSRRLSASVSPPSTEQPRRSSIFGILRRKSSSSLSPPLKVEEADSSMARRASLTTVGADGETITESASRRGSTVSSTTMNSQESPLMVYRKPSIAGFASGTRRPSINKRHQDDRSVVSPADGDQLHSQPPPPPAAVGDEISVSDASLRLKLSDLPFTTREDALQSRFPRAVQVELLDQTTAMVVFATDEQCVQEFTNNQEMEMDGQRVKLELVPMKRSLVTEETSKVEVQAVAEERTKVEERIVEPPRELTEEEQQQLRIQRAKKDSQELVRQIQNLTAKSAELTSLEVELARIERERVAAKEATQRELEATLKEQEEVEAQIEMLRNRRKELQLKAGELDRELEEEMAAAKKAGEEREYANLALQQAAKDKEAMLQRYAQVQQQFPEKIKPISKKEITPPDAVQPRSRRLTFPLPVHSPTPAPPLVLRGLFQLKKDTNIDKVSGPNRVSASTRQVLLKVPDVSQVKSKQQTGESPDQTTRQRQPTVVRKGDPKRASMLNEIQGGAVSLKKVEAPDTTTEETRNARAPSVVMSRLALSMNSRREVLQDSDGEDGEWGD